VLCLVNSNLQWFFLTFFCSQIWYAKKVKIVLRGLGLGLGLELEGLGLGLGLDDSGLDLLSSPYGSPAKKNSRAL